jgi:chemotaxis protein MotB
VEGQNIIIKKVKKRGHGGHHGGSWKVAYADFVTAMMAFFLLLWLITMAAPEKRARVSNYFKYFSIFEKGGSSFMELSKAEVKVTVIDNEGIKEANDPAQEKRRELTDDVKAILSGEEFRERLKKEVESKLADVKDQIMVNVFEGGVRIEIVDKDGNPMFPSGSSEISPDGRKILKVICENLKDNDCKIAIEGHTDARMIASNTYSNWELSTERASVARKELERYGLNPNRLIRVAGYAATEPLIKDNPVDPRNRRISILLFYRYGLPPSLPLDLNRSTNQGVGQPPPQPLRDEIRKPIDPVQNYLFSR